MASSHRVVALAYDGLCTFEFGVVTEVFALPRPELKTKSWYAFRVCAMERKPIQALGGLTVQVGAGLEAFRQADTIVIPGWCDRYGEPPAKLTSALRRAHGRGVRIVSICSGAFLLAAAGLLDGRRATTHWRYTELLAARFPQISVEPDVLWVDEGKILTSAGSAAGIDLCLHVVRSDFGAKIANQVAKRLVVPAQRDGDQSQYVDFPLAASGATSLAHLLDWIIKHLDQDLQVCNLAGQAKMSPRTFARRFRTEMGTTPYEWVTLQRLAAARRLLETTNKPVDHIAEAVGMQTAESLRHHFRRVLHTSPVAYRKKFAAER